MNGDPVPSAQPSSAEAKRNLLICGQVADAQIAAQVNHTLSTVRKVLPWIGGIAAVAGFFLARRKARRRAGSSAAHQGRAPSRRMPSFFSLALQLAPIALKLFLRPRGHKENDF